MTARASFTQADLKRAALVAVAVGMRVVVRRIDGGSEIVLEPAGDPPDDSKPVDTNAGPKQW